MKREKAPKRETLYNVTWYWKDPDNPDQLKRITWHRVEVDKPAAWSRATQNAKKKYPGIFLAKVYGGISEKIYQTIKIT